MPKTMLSRLKEMSEKNHYLDVSEQVRSIVRNRWLESQDVRAYQIKKLRKEIAQALNDKGTEKSQEQLVRELERIKRSIVGDR